jgi:ankyrin repeat protein
LIVLLLAFLLGWSLDVSVVNSEDLEGRSPLHLCAISNHFRCCAFLLRQKCISIDKLYWTLFFKFPTLLPCDSASCLVFSFLFRDKQNFTPLLLAAMHGNRAIVQLLIDAGLEISASIRPLVLTVFFLVHILHLSLRRKS